VAALTSLILGAFGLTRQYGVGPALEGPGPGGFKFVRPGVCALAFKFWHEPAARRPVDSEGGVQPQAEAGGRPGQGAGDSRDGGGVRTMRGISRDQRGRLLCTHWQQWHCHCGSAAARPGRHLGVLWT
jgi:hypothetical protein